MSKEELKEEAQEQEVRPNAEDELIHAPKGTKKGRFLLVFITVVLLLTTFMVGDNLVDLFACGGRGRGAYMTWKHPVEGQKEVSGADFLTAHRNYAKVIALLTGGANRKESEESIAQLLVFDALAASSGIEVTDKELGEFLTPRVGNQELYMQRAKAYGIAPREVENWLRRILRADRYRQLIGAGLAAPDPAEVEKLWKSRHQEYAFEYVELTTDKVAEEARAAAPEGEALKAWFDALSDAEKTKYKTEERAKAQVVYRGLGPGVKADDLLAKYPPLNPDVESAARAYYDAFYYVRFRNPDFKPDMSKGFDPMQFYLSYDQAKEQCLVEAPIYNAIEAWIADMNSRVERNETVDLLGEGQTYRFGFRNQPEMSTRADFSNGQLEGYGRYVSDVIFDPQLKPGSIHAHTVVEQNAFVIVKLLERQDARMPEFAEIEAKVKEDWIKKKQGELAVAKLEALRDKLGTRPADGEPGATLWTPEATAEAFAAAVREGGFEVVRRDWQERFVPAKAGETQTAAQTFFQQAAPLYTKKEGSVVKAEPSRDGASAFLVRVAGVRDADLSKMTPLDYQTVSQESVQTTLRAFHERFASREYLTKTYGLHLASWDAKPEGSAP